MRVSTAQMRVSTAQMRAALLGALGALALLAALALPAPASASSPPLLWQVPEDGARGEGAGRFINPRGIAADPETGHLYAADYGASRISEFSATGEFVKAFGWGVRDGAEEPQTCTDESGCQAGIEGTGVGQFRDGPLGIAVDAEGDLYAVESESNVEREANHRVQKFDSEGGFLRMWGGGVVRGGAAGTGDLTEGSATVTDLATTAKAFEVGQAIEGVGIPPGARILDRGVRTLTLSEPATASGAGVALTAPEGAGNVPADEKQEVSLEGAPIGGDFTLTLVVGEVRGHLAEGSNQVAGPTEEASGSLHVGDTVTAFANLPPGTTIAALGTDELTLSNASTATANPRLTASETTEPVPSNASAAELAEALEELAAIGAGNVAVSGPAGGPWEVEFEGPLLGDTDVEQFSGSESVSVGSQLECESSTEATSTTFQWLRHGVAIAGATSSAYEVQAADAGKALQCQVVKANSNAGSTQVSNPAVLVVPTPSPGPPEAPVFGIPAPQPGQPTAGTIETCNPKAAEWAGAASFAYQWYRNGVAIAGATSSTYEVQAADVPSAIQCAVTASNAGGAVTEVSKKRVTAGGVGSPPAPGGLAGFPAVEVPPSLTVEVATTAQGAGAGEVCTVAADCKAGVPGAADGAFANTSVGNFLALSPDSETVYVGDEGRIQEFGPEGAYQGEIAFAGALSELAGKTVSSLATVPSSGDLYLAAGGDPHVYRLDPETLALAAVEAEIEGEAAPAGPKALAVDSAGNLYLADDPPTNLMYFDPRILEFGPGGEKLIPTEAEEEACEEAQAAEEPCERFGEAGEGSGPSSTNLNGLATSAACGLPEDDLYASYHGNSSGGRDYLRAYGPAPGECATAKPPQITEQYALSVGSEEAELEAKINPRFTPDTRYHVQYGTAACIEAGGWEAPCVAARPAPPGALLGGEGGTPLATAPLFLAGLAPATAYRYRFVAQSEAGGPVHGVGGSEGEEGEDAAFATYPLPPAPKADCPNRALRGGPSARLPDCRAYEMVSPADKNGGDITTLGSFSNYPARLDQAAAGGGRLAYSAVSAFAGATTAPWSSQYLATRGGGGWSSEAIDPPRPTPPVASEPKAPRVDVHYKAFAADLCSGWLLPTPADPPLAPGAPPGYLSIYRRDNCGGGGFEAVSAAAPQNGASGSYWPALQGVSADGSRAVFAANAKLTAGASEAEVGTGPIYQLYERYPGGLRLVSVLPGGEASDERSSAGTSNSANSNIAMIEGRVNTVAGALSADGERVYWSDADGLYLRERAGKEQSAVAGGQCTEAAKACTYRIAPGSARFWAASSDGAKMLYTDGGALFEFDAAEPQAPGAMIAAGALGVLGASADLALAYFVSSADLDEAGPAAAGESNLYLSRAGAIGFIKTLAGEDVSASAESPLAALSAQPPRRAARASADGSRLAFVSAAPPPGYDNTEPASGEPAVEVFLYDAAAAGGEGELRCVSCNPSGARPAGRRLVGRTGKAVRVAAQLPVWENQLYGPRALADGGRRLFFESFEALVPRDSNGAADVYQWEAAAGPSQCEAAGAELYVASSGGCLSLISSGQSPGDSEFLDASQSGSDVFFKTGRSLVASDPGQVDVYDARVGGGFPAPEASAECEGEACQSPPGAPEDQGPASQAFRGPGNLRQGAGCAKPARRAKKLSARAKRLRRHSRRAAHNHKAGKAKRMRGHSTRLAKRARGLSKRAKRCRRRARAAGRAAP